LAGTFKTATPLSSSNTLTVKVNVTTIGTYIIATNLVDGFNFSKSGVFTALGDQDVVLTGSGTPSLAGTFTFTPSSVNSGCTFDVVVEQTPIAAGIYSCKIDGVLTNFTDRAKADIFEELLSVPYLFLDGFTSPPNGDNIPEFQIFIEKNNGTAVTAGTYNETGFLSPGYRIEIDYKETQSNGDVIIWNTSSNVFNPNPPFTITITSISATRVKGTFSGKLKDTLHPSNTSEKTITEGTFDLPIQ